MLPIVLGPNQPTRFYRGGQRIAQFRGVLDERDDVPEDWVASTTTLAGERRAGLTQLPTGALLRDAIDAEAERWLGYTPVGSATAYPPVLVKLLDAGERLPIHAHPDDAFAHAVLGSPYGKTEAWVILHADAGAHVHLGFKTAVAQDELLRWVHDQAVDELKSRMNEVPVHPGDRVLVPAGQAHAVGEGILLLELQEPSDHSLLMEWNGYAIDGQRYGHLGIGFEAALACVDTRPLDPEELILRADAPESDGAGATILPAGSEPFFRADVHDSASAHVSAGYSILVVTHGEGTLAGQWGDVQVRRGMTLVVPYSAGPMNIVGGVRLVRCRPPVPSAIRAREREVTETAGGLGR